MGDVVVPVLIPTVSAPAEESPPSSVTVSPPVLARTAVVSPSASPSSSGGCSSHEDSLTTVAEDDSSSAKSLSDSGPVVISAPGGPPIIEVKCGPLHAKMHVEQFLCPGIHQPCIELDGEMISPKEFTVRANKDKQKDWKGSIRIGKSNLRSLMEMRSFDFYNHSLFCSAKCQSRNYITPKSALSGSSCSMSEKSPTSSSESDKDSSRRSSKSSIEHLIAMQMGPKPHLYGGYGSDADVPPPSLSQFVHLSQALNNNNNIAAARNSKEELIEVDDHPHSHIHPVARAPTPQVPTTEQVTALMQNQPLVFWHQMASLGLLQDAVELVQSEVDAVKSASKGGAHPPAKAADTLSRLALTLHLGDTLAQRVRTRTMLQQSNMELERKRRFEPYPSTIRDAMKRPTYSDLLLLKSEEKPPVSTSAFASVNSAFSLPSSATTTAQQLELIMRLSALQQLATSNAVMAPASYPQLGQSTGLAPPPPAPPLIVPDSFNAQLTEALLKMQAAQATPVNPV